jgi:hypothetical protein
MWARTFDAHDIVVLATAMDTYGDIYSDTYGASRWKPLEELPEQTDTWGHGRHEDYSNFLEGREIISTIRTAFDAMAALSCS